MTSDPNGPDPGRPDFGQPVPGPPSYGASMPGVPGYGLIQEHPKATTSLVLGIIGLVVCQVVSPFAWSMGKRTVAEIDASGGRLGGRGSAQAGYVLGIVGTAILGLAVLVLIGFLAFFLIAVATTASGST